MTFDHALMILFYATVGCLGLGLLSFALEMPGLMPPGVTSTFFLGYFAGLGALIVWAMVYAALDVVKRFK